ncbi:MAG: ComF family protein [Gammaproteobacteria bacterium]|nr:ComF family protein [Gammaproteobacteria bacterium]
MLLTKLIPIHTRFFSSFLKQTISKLLPSVCILCGLSLHAQSSAYFCRACLQNLPILPQACRQCAQFLPAMQATPIPLICGMCLQHSPPFEATYALFPYAPPISNLIIQLKFHHQLSHANALGELLVQKIIHDWYQTKPLPDLIIPVPLHHLRLRERGFNQALEIAKPAAKALHIPIDAFGLKRSKSTAVQSHLKAKAREQNVAQAFVATRDYTSLSVCLVDDVITTGQTITACAKVLKQAGAKTIDVWCCARRG